MIYLLDTSVIINLIQKRDAIVKFIEKHEHDTIITSSLCAYELWSGIYRLTQKEQAIKKLQLESLLDSFGEIVPFTSSQATIAGTIYADLSNKGKLVDDVDILIAAACIESRAILVTGNTKHFSRIPSLEIISL